MLPTADYIDQKGEFEGHDIAEATHEKSNDPKSGEAVRENNDNNSGDIDLQKAANPTEEVQLDHPHEKPQEESGKQNVEGLADDRISANPTEEVQLGHPLEKPQEESGKQKVEGLADDRISANPTEEVQLGHPHEKPQEESGKQNVEGLAHDWRSGNSFHDDFQYEKHVEDDNLGLELGINEQETDTDLSGDSGGMLITRCFSLLFMSFQFLHCNIFILKTSYGHQKGSFLVFSVFLELCLNSSLNNIKNQGR